MPEALTPDICVIGAGEAPPARNHPDAKAGESLLGVVSGNRGDDVMDVSVGAGECGYARRVDPEHAGGRGIMGPVRGGDQGFRRHATVIEAVAAHLAPLDQHHRHAERGGRRRKIYSLDRLGHLAITRAYAAWTNMTRGLKPKLA